MQHIIFDCPHNGGAEIWEMVNNILGKRGLRWDHRWGWKHVLASGTTSARTSHPDDKTVETLFDAIVTEAAFVVWKLRNERVLSSRPDAERRIVSKREAESRLRVALEVRVSSELMCADRNERGRKGRAFRRKSINAIWKKIAVYRRGEWTDSGVKSKRWFLVGSDGTDPEEDPP